MKLLVSVRDSQEARDAVAGGADWIDLKEPVSGSLGAVNAADARVAVNAVAGRRPISAALGELTDWRLSSELLTISGIQVVKLGLADCEKHADWQSRWTAAFEMCSQLGKHLAAVIYADWSYAGAPDPESVLKCAFRAGAKYSLIDTFDKQGLSSIDILGAEQTGRLLQLARQRGLTTVLAGSLRDYDLSFIADMPVDIVAIRGAACLGNRISTLDSAKVQSFRRRMEIATEDAKVSNSHLATRN